MRIALILLITIIASQAINTQAVKPHQNPQQKPDSSPELPDMAGNLVESKADCIKRHEADLTMIAKVIKKVKDGLKKKANPELKKL